MSVPGFHHVESRERDSLSHFFGVVRRRWFILVAFVVACMVAAGAREATSTEEYRATASVAFGDASLSDAALQVERGGGDPERDAGTKVLIARSREVANAVRRELHLDTPAADLQRAVTVEAAPNANVLEITATSDDPNAAALLANAFADQYIALEAQKEVRSIEAAERDLQQQIAQLPEGSPARVSLEQSLQRLAELRAIARGDARVISRAMPPSAETGLGLEAWIVIGGLIGLATGLGVIFLVESVDRRINSLEELEREYRMPALAGIPRSSFGRSLAALRADDLEPYRILRSALDFAAAARSADTLLVTSAVSGEGKTTVSVDLAHVVALTGRRVVLVEVDLRRPTFRNQFDLDGQTGLTSAIAHHQPVSELLVRPFAALPNLSVLPAGRVPPNPSELLGTEALSDVLTDLQSGNTMVILDAAPLNPVSDTQVLLNNPSIEAAIVVARLGAVTRDEVRRARAILDRHMLQPLGIVVTDLRDPARYGYESYDAHGLVEPMMPVPLRRSFERDAS